MPAAFFSSTAAGGDLRMKVNEPSVIDADLRRNDFTDPVVSAGIVFLAERHDVDAMPGQGRANRRRRVGFTGINL